MAAARPSNPVDIRLDAMKINLPTPSAPVANYVPFVISGNLLYVSGQLPLEGNAVAVTGFLGNGVSIEEGQRAARLCAINILAQVKTALDGDFSRIRRLVRLGGFVASTPDFADHAQVVNGASDLMVAVLDEAGRHTRAAVGVSALPKGAAVEVDAIFEIA